VPPTKQYLSNDLFGGDSFGNITWHMKD